MNSFTMASACAGWSRGTMWPASYTRRKVKFAADCFVPAGVPATVQLVTVAALKSAVCGHLNARVQA